MIEDALRAKLNADITLVSGRIRPNQDAQDDTDPRIVYARRDHVEVGRTLTNAGDLGKDLFSLDIYSNRAEGNKDVKDVEDQVRNKFDGARGLWSYSGGSNFVQHCRIEENTDDEAPPAFDEDTGTHAVSLILTVIYEHPVPTG